MPPPPDCNLNLLCEGWLNETSTSCPQDCSGAAANVCGNAFCEFHR